MLTIQGHKYQQKNQISALSLFTRIYETPDEELGFIGYPKPSFPKNHHLQKHQIFFTINHEQNQLYDDKNYTELHENLKTSHITKQRDQNSTKPYTWSEEIVFWYMLNFAWSFCFFFWTYLYLPTALLNHKPKSRATSASNAKIRSLMLDAVQESCGRIQRGSYHLSPSTQTDKMLWNLPPIRNRERPQKCQRENQTRPNPKRELGVRLG